MNNTEKYTAELDLHLHDESDKAIRVSHSGDLKKSVWLAKSQIEIERIAGAYIWIVVPEWLGVQKGLL
jgi:hypothetical protein